MVETAPPSPVTSSTPTAPSTAPAPCPPDVPVVKSALDAPKKYPTVEVGGVLQLDTGWFHQSARNRLAVGDADDGTSFRTARIWAKGSLIQGTNYMLELDYGALASATPGRPNFQNAYIEQENIPHLGTVRVGRWKQPFSLETTATSIRFLTFIERANLFTFVPFRRTGVGFFDYTEDERWTYAASVFRSNDDGYGDAVGDNNGMATAARITHALYNENDGADVMHFGVGHTYNDAPNKNVRFGRFPEFAVSTTPVGGTGRVTPNFFDTGVLLAEDYHVVGLEFLWIHESLSIQAEGMMTAVNRIGAPQAIFPSFYVFGSWFLTGEHRNYLPKVGGIDRVRPNRNFITSKEGGIEGPGAWELAVRISQVDVNDAGVNGGRLTDLTLGINWHLNPNAKLQFNYIHAFQRSPVFGSSNADVYGLRAAYDF